MLQSVKRVVKRFSNFNTHHVGSDLIVFRLLMIDKGQCLLDKFIIFKGMIIFNPCIDSMWGKLFHQNVPMIEMK